MYMNAPVDEVGLALNYPAVAQLLGQIDVDDIDFRAAALAAIAPSNEAVKYRVREAVRNADAFVQLFCSLIGDAAAAKLDLHNITLRDLEECLERADSVGSSEKTKSMLLSHFYRELGRDSRFRVLVIEQIAADRRFHNPFVGADGGSGSSGLWQKIRSWIAERMDKHAQATQMAKLFVLLSGSLYASYRIAIDIVPRGPDGAVVIPIEAQVKANGTDIPVKLSGGGGAKLPIEATLVVSGKEIPVNITVRGITDGVPLQFRAADPIAIKVQAENTLAVKVAQSGSAPGAAASSIAGDCKGIEAAKVACPLDQPLKLDPKSIEELLQFEKSIDKIQADVNTVRANTSSLDQALASVQAATLITLPKNGHGTVFLKWFDSAGKEAVCDVDVSATRVVEDQYIIQLSKQICPGLSASGQSAAMLWNHTLGLNQPAGIGVIPFHIQVVTSAHHWYGQSRVTIRFQPDFAGILPRAAGISAELISH
jgi:hypothetical protein